MARSNNRVRDARDHEGLPPYGGVRGSGIRPRSVTLAEQLDARELVDPCRCIEDIWKRYKPVVWARLQRPTIPEDVREDLLSKVLTVMHEDILDKQRLPAVPGRTLFSITTHVICNFIRVRKRQPQMDAFEALESEPALSSRSSPERALEQARRKRFVRWILTLMADDERQLLEMVHFMGLTAEEIAGELGEPSGTVRYRVHEARKSFRALAERYSAKLEGAL